MRKFSHLIYIGRFQPYHNGHHALLTRALSLAERVIVICGSMHRPASIRDPWNLLEREGMIRGCFSALDNSRIVIRGIRDRLYNDQQWVRDIQGIVSEHAIQLSSRAASTPNPHIGIIGHIKDHTSYYLNYFPQWEMVDADHVDGINATDIREAYFQAVSQEWETYLPSPVRQYLHTCRDTDFFRQLHREYNFIRNYKKSWASAPYPPTFLTSDAVVVQSGHLLLIERKAEPGKGLLALPGGFVNQTERLEAAMLRELREETRLKVPEAVLKGSIKHLGVFDHPNRSLRGRTVTHAYLIHLKDTAALPSVKGGDDAAKAIWVPLSAIDPSVMFEDHYDIIEHMLAYITN